MNKRYTEFLTSLNMTVKGYKAYGIIQGFETNFVLVPLDNQFPVRIHFSCFTTDEQKRNILDDLRKAGIKFARFEFTTFGLYVGLNDFTSNKILKRLGDIINNVIGILSSNGAIGAGCCPVCGEPCTEENARPYNLEYGKIIIDDECAKRVNNTIAEENKDFENAPNNYFRGFLGAIIGGIVGAGIAIVLYLVGFVASISSIVAVGLGAVLYAKFGGKQNKMMIVIVSLTTLVFMVLAILGIYIVVSGNIAVEEGVDISAIQAFGILMKTPDFKALFLKDMIMTLGFSVLGVVCEAIYLSKKIKRKKEMNSVY